MREIVFDTETTGLEPDKGDRVVEIGAIELVNHVATANTFHVYINPERPMPEEAFKVHGLSDAFLRDKPVFAAVADDFLRFAGDAPLIAHNAAFDVAFLNAELRRAGKAPLAAERAIDTRLIAKRRFPGAPASLDALCRRFGIDNSNRTLHGALLDSQLLAEVYLELVGGRQPGFGLDAEPAPAPAARAGSGAGPDTGSGAGPGEPGTPRARPRALPSRIAPEEAAAHEAFVAALGPSALWARV